MSIASEITRLQEAKRDILSAIAEKGVEVPVGASLSDCAQLIASIPQGGSALTDITNDCTYYVNFLYKKLLYDADRGILFIELKISKDMSGNAAPVDVLKLPDTIKFGSRVYIPGATQSNAYVYQLNQSYNAVLSNCWGDVYSTNENGTINASTLSVKSASATNLFYFNGFAQVEAV